MVTQVNTALDTYRWLFDQETLLLCGVVHTVG